MYIYLYMKDPSYIYTFNIISTDEDMMLKFILRFNVPVIACVQKLYVIMLCSTEQFLIVCCLIIQ